MVKRTFGGRAEANFAIFPSREMAAAMKESESRLVAEIDIPHNGPAESIKMNVGTQDLRKVHALLCY